MRSCAASVEPTAGCAQRGVSFEVCMCVCVSAHLKPPRPPQLSPIAGSYREGVDLLCRRRSSPRPLSAAQTGRHAGKQEGSAAPPLPLPPHEVNST